jgi:LysM repeat protein
VVVKKFTTTNPPWQSNLSGIAAHSGRSVGQLQSWNGIANANVIYTDQEIWVDPPGNYAGKVRSG